MADIANIKSDILNELQNKKYYINKELERVAGSDIIEHKLKINKIIDLVNQIVEIDNCFKSVEQIFVVTPPASVEPEQVDPNIVEPLNDKGQSHSE